jgi:effector-binding domain-containing protein
VYTDGAEHRDQGADVEVAMPADRRLKGSARVVVHELAGAEAAARLVHTDSYDSLPGAHRALMDWTQA